MTATKPLNQYKDFENNVRLHNWFPKYTYWIPKDPHKFSGDSFCNGYFELYLFFNLKESCFVQIIVELL